MLLGAAAHELDGLFAAQVLDRQLQHGEVLPEPVDLRLVALEGHLGRETLGEELGGSALLGVPLDDAHAPEGDDAAKVGGELLGDDPVLVDDAKRCPSVAEDRVDLVALACAMEEEASERGLLLGGGAAGEVVLQRRTTGWWATPSPSCAPLWSASRRMLPLVSEAPPRGVAVGLRPALL